MFKPTLEYIKRYMLSEYDGYEIAESSEPDLINWLFVVYIPEGGEIIIGQTVQSILDSFMEIMNEENECVEKYNIRKEFENNRKCKYFAFNGELYSYEWFVHLAICVENNFIVDSVEIFSDEPAIYNIEPVTPRLKVRIK